VIVKTRQMTKQKASGARLRIQYEVRYATPTPSPACNPNGGYYDANGNWVPDPNWQVLPAAAPAPYGY